MDFIKFNNMIFLLINFFNYMRKKIDNKNINVQLEKEKKTPHQTCKLWQHESLRQTHKPY